MNFSFYIAKRYLLARKSHNLINVISLISVVGVGVGAFALIVVLSVFNGFGLVIGKLIHSTTPDLLIEPTQGRWIVVENLPSEGIKNLQGVKAWVEAIEEDALFRFDDKQHIGRLKAVSEAYAPTGILDSLLQEGNPELERFGQPYAVAGAGVAWFLGLHPAAEPQFLQIYVIGNQPANAIGPDPGFEMETIPLGGIFSAHQEVDEQWVLVPLHFAQRLMGLEHKINRIEVFADHQKSVDKLQKQIVALLGPEFTVKNQFEQQETIYKILKSEKWAIFIILAFILFMATFNVIGSLTMLIVDKQRDSDTLKKLGASNDLIRKIFLYEGLLISIAGGIIGLMLGIFVVWLQQYFGLIRLGNGSGSFVIDAYPVDLQGLDILLVMATVLAIGGISSFFTVDRLSRKLKNFQPTN